MGEVRPVPALTLIPLGLGGWFGKTLLEQEFTTVNVMLTKVFQKINPDYAVNDAGLSALRDELGASGPNPAYATEVASLKSALVDLGYAKNAETALADNLIYPHIVLQELYTVGEIAIVVGAILCIASVVNGFGAARREH
jgi:hypothetical protein